MPPDVSTSSHPWLIGTAVIAAAAIASAAYNRSKASGAEFETPPVGSFVEVDGTRLHYLRRGSGPCIVLLHGNGVMLQDWLVSGVFDALAKTHDVIAFDRPGFGYSDRPRTVLWTAQAQAALLAQALDQLGIAKATVVGHSFGTMVALALGLDYPDLVTRLVLLGGYFFPTPRADLILNAGPAIPLIGDVMRYTISPLAGRAMLPKVEELLFAPAPIAPSWADGFPTEMVLRPSQVRATAADAGLAIPSVAALSKRYGELTIPTTIVAGKGDKIVAFEGQSQRLHETMPRSEFVLIEDVGHMVHYSARDRVLRAIAPAATAPVVASPVPV
ncbi:MAG: alpha/beta hydrolase [Novosphingobium sp.]|nr:alpha/beta hydrolase [Novosphingobium sp.]